MQLVLAGVLSVISAFSYSARLPYTHTEFVADLDFNTVATSFSHLGQPPFLKYRSALGKNHEICVNCLRDII